MNATPDDWDDEIDDDEATLAASDSALDEIRAEAKRVAEERAEAGMTGVTGGFDPSEDPTTVMIKPDPDLADDPTDLADLDSGQADDPTELADLDSDLAGDSNELADLDPDPVDDPTELAELDTDPVDDPTELADVDPDLAEDPTELADLDTDLAEEPTVIANFDPAHDVTVIDGFDSDDPTSGTFDPSDDPTTVMVKGELVEIGESDSGVRSSARVATENAETDASASEEPAAKDRGSPRTPSPTPEVVTNAPVAVGPHGSLIEGKAPPAASASYWDRGEMAADREGTAAATTGKGPVPKWFLATSLLAVLMAVGLVLLVMWALTGSAA